MTDFSRRARLTAASLFLLSAAAWSAPETEEYAVEICFNYGCASRQMVYFAPARLSELFTVLRQSKNAAEERAALSWVMGRLYALAAEQSPIGADKGGNYADAGVYGRMDCVDHSTTSTSFLLLLENHQALRWHRVLPLTRRMRFFVMQHDAALIETLPQAGENAEKYVVDSWFRDNGEPAVIMPLEDWQNGKDPEDV